MGVLIGVCLFVISIVGGVRLIGLGIKAVNKVFDGLDDLIN